MENNNIDKLFRDNLTNLAATPNEKVWNNIADKLAKKKKKVIPFWWFSIGVAAVLILGLFLFPFADKNTSIEKSIPTIITESPKEKENSILKTTPNILNTPKKEEIIIVKEKIDRKNLQQKTQTPTQQQTMYASTTIEEKTPKNPKKEPKKNFLAENKPKKTNNLAIAEKISIVEKNEETEKNSIKIKEENNTLIAENNLDKNEKLSILKEEKESIKVPKKQWTIAPSFAILNSNSFANTSPIDQGLANSTEGKNTFSYGVQIAYQINDKWTIQSGIHQQDVSYQNRQIAVLISSPSNASAAVLNSGETFSFDSGVNGNSDFASSGLVDNLSSNGNLTQDFGYIEIPVEIKYNFSNNPKLETQLVAGFSSLFLNRNTLNLQTNSFSRTGEVNNLNRVNFSGNLGFDFSYQLHKNWSLNINPMFKAQLNTFSGNSNGFAPFNIGVYSGVKYRF